MGNWWNTATTVVPGRLSGPDGPRTSKRENLRSTSVIDMDGIRVDDVDEVHGSGWTGYSWNRELFTRPASLPHADLHRRDYAPHLNDPPRDWRARVRGRYQK